MVLVFRSKYKLIQIDLIDVDSFINDQNVLRTYE